MPPLSANQAARKITGVDTLALLGQTHLVAENQKSGWFTPTELGKRLHVSGQAFNRMLEEHGLQVRRSDDGEWTPMEAADGLFRRMDTGKRHNDGSMIQQIKWSDAVLERLQIAEAV
jgi:hypothetical protein